MLDASIAATTRWELYRVLAEPVRLRLLALAAEEELTIGELAVLLDENQPNVSRHVTPLKSAGLVLVRRQGTRALVRLAEAAAADPVVADALASGRSLCEGDGSLAKIADVLRERDRASREFFALASGSSRDVNAAATDGDATAAYVAALARLLPSRALAIDAGTGDGALLDVLAPSFERVIAVDRSDAQLERARARVTARGYTNVTLLKAELGAPELTRERADVVFASRLVHHAPRPLDLVRQLRDLARPGGAVLVLDYERHDDESMRDEADLWLGFEPKELLSLAKQAGLEDGDVFRIPAAWCGKGKDSHLPWQVLVAKRPAR